MVRVFPAAMRAAGFAGDKKQALVFFRTYADAFKQMQSDPLPPPPVAEASPTPPIPAEVAVSATTGIEGSIPEKTNGHKAEVIPPNGGTKLKRGDVKRMAEQEAETLTSSNPTKPD